MTSSKMMIILAAIAILILGVGIGFGREIGEYFVYIYLLKEW